MYKMQRLEVSGAVWPIYGSLGVKRLNLDLVLIDDISEYETKILTLQIKYGF